MSDKVFQNNQENICTEKKLQVPLVSPSLKNDMSSIVEDRILQETQQIVHVNAFQSGPHRSTKPDSRVLHGSEHSSQTKTHERHNEEKDFRQGMGENSSPSVNTNNISYRIVNEILNTQNSSRNALKAKVNLRKAESSSKKGFASQGGSDKQTELLKSSSIREDNAVFEENEELKRLQEKMTKTSEQLQRKREELQEARRLYETENMNFDENERKLKEKQTNLKENYKRTNSTKGLAQVKSDLGASKEKLRQLRSELQPIETEIFKLKEAIEKQENDKSEIEQSVNKRFGSQIQEFEDAIISIEGQKFGIYTKLTEAMGIHNQNLEQKAMLKEDLSGKLFQRADLVAQREDLEQLIESFRLNNLNEIELYNLGIAYNEHIEQRNLRIQELRENEELLKKDLENVETKPFEGGVSEERIEREFNDLVALRVLLSEKILDIGLPSVEDIYQSFLVEAGLDPENITVEEFKQDRNGFKSLIREVLRCWEDETVNFMREALEKESGEEVNEEFGINDLERLFEDSRCGEILELYNGFIAKLEEEDSQGEDENKVEGDVESNEETKEKREILREIQEEIETLEKEKESMQGEFEERREVIENALMKDAEAKFLAQKKQQEGEIAESDLLEIVEANKMKRINRYMNLQNELGYLEEIISSNTTSVDQRILPSIQELLPTIEESVVLIFALKKQQILLLETEDEVRGQLHSLLEYREKKIRRKMEKLRDNSEYSTEKLIELLKLFEVRAKPLRDEISHLESHIIENDKISTEALVEERKIQKELERVNQELLEMNSKQKPKITSLKTQIEVLEKNTRDLTKLSEQLEIQKLALEQQFIEQNYLNSELSLPSDKDLKFESNREEESEYEKQGSQQQTANSEARQVRDFREDIASGQKFNLSPIQQNSQSPEEQQKDQQNNFINDLNDFSQQFIPGKESINEWNCFSPLESLGLGMEASKNKVQTPQKKNAIAGAKDHKPEEIQKDNTSYLRNYQKKLVQKSDVNKKGPAVSSNAEYDSRTTKSIPQIYHTSPKETEMAARAQNMAQGKNFLSIQNFSKTKGPQETQITPSNSHNLQNALSTKKFTASSQKLNPDAVLDESVSLFSPKALSLHINSLKAQTELQGEMNLRQNRNSENSTGKQIGSYAPMEKFRGKSSFAEQRNVINDQEEIDEKKRLKKRKSFSVETSIQLEESDGTGAQQKEELDIDENSSEGNMMEGMTGGTTGRVLNSLQEVMGYQGEENSIRSKLKGIEIKDIRRTFIEHGTGENSGREGRGHLNLEDLDLKAENPSYEYLGSLGEDRYGKQLHGTREFFDFRSRVMPNEHQFNETFFIETIKPLLQGNLVYKKFTNYQSLKRAAFDPLTANVYPPEVCGYGVRSIKLHPNLDKIEIRNTSKLGVELSIPIDNILRPVVPQITMDILRVQKKVIESHHLGNIEDKFQIADIFGDLSTKALLAKRGVHNLNNGLEKYLTCSYYSFSLLLEKNGKIEFVVSSYSVFKEWINGINLLLKYKKHLPKMKYKLASAQRA